MFDLIDQIAKETWIFCLLRNCTRDNLIPIVKSNFNSYDNEKEEINEAESTKTHIYSDCFQSY